MGQIGPNWASTSMFVVVLFSFMAQYGPIWPILGQMFGLPCFGLTGVAQSGPSRPAKGLVLQTSAMSRPELGLQMTYLHGIEAQAGL